MNEGGVKTLVHRREREAKWVAGDKTGKSSKVSPQDGPGNSRLLILTLA